MSSAIASSNSPSTEHYFHYYLVDIEGNQIDSMGIMLDTADSQPPTTKVESDEPKPPTIAAQKPKRTILHLLAVTKERFQTFRGKDMSENDAVIALMDKAELAKELERELNDARAQISSLEVKLDSIEEQRDSVEAEESSSVNNADTIPNSELVTSDEKSLKLENPTDAVLLLVKSMSQLTSRFDLFLERQFAPSTTTFSSDIPPQPPDKHSSTISQVKERSVRATQASASNAEVAPLSSGSSKSVESVAARERLTKNDSSVADTEALLNHAIDTIMAHNARADSPEAKWYIGINPLKDIINSQSTITRVVKRRKAEIDAHHQKHDLDKYHNGNFHRGQGYTDFFNFS